MFNSRIKFLLIKNDYGIQKEAPFSQHSFNSTLQVMPKLSNLSSTLTLKTTTSIARPKKGKSPDYVPGNQTLKMCTRLLTGLSRSSIIYLLRILVKRCAVQSRENIFYNTTQSPALRKIDQFLKTLFHSENNYLFFIVQ